MSRTKQLRILVVALGSLSALADAQSRGGSPDLILTSAKVFTADSARPWAEALAIRGDRILAVGSTKAIFAMAGRGTRRIDAGGRVIIPGINDAHTHHGCALSDGVTFSTGGPTPDPSTAVVLDSVAAIVKRSPEGTWIYGSIGATLLDDPRARRSAFDSIAHRHPVFLTGYHGHGLIMNSAAITSMGIRDEQPDPAGGWYEREAGTGRVSGLAHEYAKHLLARQRCQSTAESVDVRRAAATEAEMISFGITSIQNMATDLEPPSMMRVFRATGSPLRVRIIAFPMTTPSGRSTSEWDDEFLRARGRPGDRVRLSGIKWILDGTPIERLAVQRTPYFDRAGWYGRPNFPPDTIRVMLAEALRGDQQMMLHAVGDSTVALVLRYMAGQGRDADWRRLRLRLEHSDGLARDLIPLAKQLGVIVVQNPTHFVFAELPLRFSSHVLAGNQLLRSLLEAGIPLALGSDGPLNPYLSIMFATLHPTNPGEALSREQAVVAFTWRSAYAEFAEHEKGMLRPGMRADLAVLSQDLFMVAPPEMPKTTSVLTMIGGKVVYDSHVLKTTARE